LYDGGGFYFARLELADGKVKLKMEKERFRQAGNPKERRINKDFWKPHIRAFSTSSEKSRWILLNTSESVKGFHYLACPPHVSLSMLERKDNNNNNNKPLPRFDRGAKLAEHKNKKVKDVKAEGETSQGIRL
jgi:hypothetical protein